MSFLNQTDIRKIETKIRTLEEMTSSELKIIVCQYAWFGLERKAHQLFKQYELRKTKERNTVLLLIVEKDHELMIYGDKGIHEKTSADHWPKVRDAILNEFKIGDYYSGLTTGLELIADNLIEQFPTSPDNNNEICNELIFV